MKPDGVWVAAAAALLATLAPGQDRDVPVDNEWVRVVQVHRAQPGVKTRPHEHTINRVMIYLNAGGQTVTYVESGKVERQTWRAGEAIWSPRGGLHVAEISGPEPARIVEVELKREASAPTPSRRKTAMIDPRHFKIELTNAQVRVLRMKLRPGEKTPAIAHSAHRLVTYLSDQELEVTREGQAAEQWRRQAGQVEWLDSDRVETLRNTGTGLAEVIFVELN